LLVSNRRRAELSGNEPVFSKGHHQGGDSSLVVTSNGHFRLVNGRICDGRAPRSNEAPLLSHQMMSRTTPPPIPRVMLSSFAAMSNPRIEDRHVVDDGHVNFFEKCKSRRT
jgi:hypothetical protein